MFYDPAFVDERHKKWTCDLVEDRRIYEYHWECGHCVTRLVVDQCLSCTSLYETCRKVAPPGFRRYGKERQFESLQYIKFMKEKESNMTDLRAEDRNDWPRRPGAENHHHTKVSLMQ